MENKEQKQRLFVSFSGGRTSAYMLYHIWNSPNAKNYDIKVLFANTGQEHPKTLEFVDRCSKEWGIPIIWIEGVVIEGERVSTQGKVVTYETACRDGSIFAAVCKKYGLPNTSYPHCTRELKSNPMHNYLRSIGWEAKSYDTAIGIRADEIDRMDENRKEKRYIYPLVKAKVTKEMILNWWSTQPFDLEVKEHQGNCTWCWKKSLRKHLTLIKENPEFFEVPAELERLYENAGAGTDEEKPRRFFRKKMTVADLFELSQRPFTSFTEEELQLSFGCTESCEIF